MATKISHTNVQYLKQIMFARNKTMSLRQQYCYRGLFEVFLLTAAANQSHQDDS